MDQYSYTVESDPAVPKYFSALLQYELLKKDRSAYPRTKARQLHVGCYWQSLKKLTVNFFLGLFHPNADPYKYVFIVIVLSIGESLHISMVCLESHLVRAIYDCRVFVNDLKIRKYQSSLEKPRGASQIEL